jgi:polysaccharide biosynthesis transport protein
MNSQFKVTESDSPGGHRSEDLSLAAQIRALFSIFSRRWRMVLGATVVALGLAVVWLLQAVPIYTATTQLLIDARKERVLREEAVVGDITLDSSGIATEVSLVRSFSVARRVVARLTLDQNKTFLADMKAFTLRGWVKDLLATGEEALSLGPPAVTDAKAPAAPREDGGLLLSPEIVDLVAAVQRAVSVRRVGPTYFIEVSYSHSDPTLAADLANAVAESYLVEQLEARYQGAQRAANWLSERVTVLRVQLEASERALAEHRSTHNLIKAQAGTLAEQQAAEINTQLVLARSQTVEKKAKYEQAQRILNEGAGIENVTAVVDSPGIVALRTQGADLARQEADLLTRYGPEHPSIVKLRAERDDLERQISREVGRVVQTLKTDYEFALKKEKSLETSLLELTGAKTNDQVMIRLRELEREVQANRVLYDSLLTRFKEAEQQTSLQTAESRVTAPAFSPSAPSFPRKSRTLLLALFAGLTLGIGLAYLLEQIENGFTTVEQLEEAMQFPVLAVVPQLSGRERTVDGRQLTIPEYVAMKPLSRFGESIRSIRISAMMSNIDEPPKLILVTSSVPAEGKSTIAQSLAHSAAASNQRVLLIDCDLRHPSTSKFFKLHEGPGLTDLLMGQVPAERVFLRGPLPNCTVVPAGTATPHPPDILGSERLRALLGSLRQNYDVIFLDAPPLSPVIDGSILSKLVDKVIYVVQWRTTPRDIVARGMQLVDNPRQKVAGMVINNAQLGMMASYSSYYSYYHKKYDKYYSS